MKMDSKLIASLRKRLPPEAQELMDEVESYLGEDAMADELGAEEDAEAVGDEMEMDMEDEEEESMPMFGAKAKSKLKSKVPY